MKKVFSLLLLLVCILWCACGSTEQFTATANGFGGNVSVALTIEDGVITDVTAEGPDETQGIGSRAIEALPEMIKSANSVDVDKISGATITSTAVLSAAKDALEQSGAVLTEIEVELGKMVPGTYEGIGKGFHSMITVSVTVSEDTIESVVIGQNDENLMIGDLAFPIITKSILANQSLADVVAGVTFTSNGINAAVCDALRKAGASEAMISAVLTSPIPTEANPGDTETDIVVVGAGSAGMVAAMQAADLGANVILLEKEGITGGSSRLSHGCIWAVDYAETNQEYNFTAEEIHDYFVQKCGVVNNDEVFYRVVNNTGDGLRYLMANGGKSDGVGQLSNGKEDPRFRSIIFDRNGAGLATFLEEQVRSRKNIDLRLNASASDLLVEDGKVSGVTVLCREGSYTIRAKKVILATGGFTYDSEMLTQYADGREKNNMLISGIGTTGDGHRMGLEVGGTLVGDGGINIFGVEGRQDSMSIYVLYYLPLIVDKTGNQIAAMDEHYGTICDKIQKTEDGRAFIIYDAAQAMTTWPPMPELVKQGCAYSGETLDDLAAVLGVDAENLKATVKTHNEHVKNHETDEWGTEADTMTLIGDGPYYAYCMVSTLMGTITGLKVDDTMHVVRQDGTPVENLYATGELIFGNMFNDLYPMSGTALTLCISSGQLAAQDAVNELK